MCNNYHDHEIEHFHQSQRSTHTPLPTPDTSVCLLITRLQYLFAVFFFVFWDNIYNEIHKYFELWLKYSPVQSISLSRYGTWPWSWDLRKSLGRGGSFYYLFWNISEERCSLFHTSQETTLTLTSKAVCYSNIFEKILWVMWKYHIKLPPNKFTSHSRFWQFPHEDTTPPATLVKFDQWGLGPNLFDLLLAAFNKLHKL